MRLAISPHSTSADKAPIPLLLLCVVVSALLSSCGSSDTTSSTGYKKGTFAPSADYAAKCATPRSGTDPSTGKAFPDKPGTANDEKAFLRSWTNDFYLWYRDVPDTDWTTIAKPIDYFNVLKTSAVTA